MVQSQQEKVVEKVNELVANQGVFFVKLHQYHWYVQGPHFFTLHVKLEELYDQSNAYYDAFAERLIAQGEKPYSTLTEYLEHASISEKPYDEKLSAETMVANVVADFRTIKAIAIEGIEAASEAGDYGTEDMLIEYIDSIDINVWMLQAYLGEDADKNIK